MRYPQAPHCLRLQFRLRNRFPSRRAARRWRWLESRRELGWRLTRTKLDPMAFQPAQAVAATAPIQDPAAPPVESCSSVRRNPTFTVCCFGLDVCRQPCAWENSYYATGFCERQLLGLQPIPRFRAILPNSASDRYSRNVQRFLCRYRTIEGTHCALVEIQRAL